jgi:hypothetical protein
MTEQEWLECDDPSRMLLTVYGRPDTAKGQLANWVRLWSPGLRYRTSIRKLRLFAAACFRRIVMADPPVPCNDLQCAQKAVEVAERMEDGLVASSDLQIARWTTQPRERYLDDVSNRCLADCLLEICHGLLADDEETLIRIADKFAYAAHLTHVYSLHGLPPDVGMYGNIPTQDWTTPDRNQSSAARQWQAHLMREVFGNPFCAVETDPAWLTSAVVALAQPIYEEQAFDRLPILANALEDAGCHRTDILGHCRSPGPHVRGCWVVDLLAGKR